MRRLTPARLLVVGCLAAAATAVTVGPAAAATNHQHVLSWGSSGTGSGQFGEPTDVAVDGEGNVFVVDPINKKVQKFTPDGAFLTGFNKACPLPTCFATLGGPTSIAASGSTVWVADTASSSIVKYSSAGQFQMRITSLTGSQPGAFGQPRGIAVDDASGKVYVVGSSGSAVHVFNANGTVAGAFGTGASGSGFVVEVESGTVYVGTSNRLSRLSIRGALLGQTDLSPFITEEPRGVAFDHTGNVIVTSRFQGFSWIGAFSPTFTAGAIPTVLNPPFGALALTAPKGLDADPTTGFVYVAESSTDRITKFGPPATLTLSFTGDGSTTPGRVFTLTAPGQTTQTFVVDGDPASPEPSTVVTSVAATTWNVALNQTNVQVKRITCSNGVGSDDWAATSVNLSLVPNQSISCEFYVEWIG